MRLRRFLGERYPDDRNGRHTVAERMLCWLLMICDRVDEDEMHLTHEQIARHFGTRRAGVTEVAHSLRERGVLKYGRGRLQILDRVALEASVCECYQAIGQQNTAAQQQHDLTFYV